MNKVLLATLLALTSIVATNVFANSCHSCKPRCEKPRGKCVRMVPQYTCPNKECKTDCWEVCPPTYKWDNETMMNEGEEMMPMRHKTMGKKSY
jgi:hypothetical protein